MTDDLTRARERRTRRATPPAGAFGPSGRKQRQIDRVMLRVDEATFARDLREGRLRPTPGRITMALNIADLYGPEVDEACGVEEPAVDQWETGELVPTVEQLRRLAALTGFKVRFFYLPPPELEPGQVFVCPPNGAR